MSNSNDPGTSERPISASLAAVLAAAAKGSQPLLPVYVVARYEPNLEDQTRPFDVQEPVPTRELAEAVKQQAEADNPGVAYGIFGPFVNEDPVPPLNQDRVKTIVVTTSKGDTLPIEGNKYDALFFSYEAVEKFVLPLYVQEYGTKYAGEVLARFNEHPLALMAHLPWSEEVFADSDPTLHGIPVFFEQGLAGKFDRELLPPPGLAQVTGP